MSSKCRAPPPTLRCFLRPYLEIFPYLIYQHPVLRIFSQGLSALVVLITAQLAAVKVVICQRERTLRGMETVDLSQESFVLFAINHLGSMSTNAVYGK